MLIGNTRSIPTVLRASSEWVDLSQDVFKREHPTGRRIKSRQEVHKQALRPQSTFKVLSGANFGFDKDTSKLMILVSFMVQKFARWTRSDNGANF
jgi:hypothetical protein